MTARRTPSKTPWLAALSAAELRAVFARARERAGKARPRRASSAELALKSNRA